MSSAAANGKYVANAAMDEADKDNGKGSAPWSGSGGEGGISDAAAEAAMRVLDGKRNAFEKLIFSGSRTASFHNALVMPFQVGYPILLWVTFENLY